MQDKYIVYPAPNDSFVGMPLPPPEQNSKIGPARYTSDSAESLLSAPPPSPKPLHFHLQASNLTRAATCVSDAIHDRDVRVSESEKLNPVRERRSRKPKPARNIGPTRPDRQHVQLQRASTQHMALSLPPAVESTAEGQRGVPAAYLENVSRGRITIRSPEPVQEGGPPTMLEKGRKFPGPRRLVVFKKMI